MDSLLRRADSAAEDQAITGSTSTTGLVPLIGAASVGAAVALSLGLYGRLHTATGLSIDPIRHEQMLAFKSTLTSIGAGLALFQLVSALWLYRGEPLVSRGGEPVIGPAPRWLGPAHRWSGTAAFVATMPAGYHCLWSLGYQTPTTRVAVHSLLGCAFYGAFATKLLAVRSNRLPGWALPLVGATVVTLMVGLWFSSALWFFTGSL